MEESYMSYDYEMISDTLKPLSKKETIDAFIKYQNGDKSARTYLISHNIRLVYYLASKYKSTKYDMDELFSIGQIGLVRAVDTFDLSKEIHFATYASRCIINEILMFLRRNKKYQNDVSLETPLSVDDKGNELSFQDFLSDPDTNIIENYEKGETIEEIRNLVFSLPEKEREAIYLYFGFYGDKRYTQKEIAEKLNISQSYVSRLIGRILKKLKKQMVSSAKKTNNSPSIKSKAKLKKENEFIEFDSLEIAIPTLESNKKIQDGVKKMDEATPEKMGEVTSEKVNEAIPVESNDIIIEQSIDVSIFDEDYRKTLERLQMPDCIEILSNFTTKEAVIISLKLGFIAGKSYKTEELARFLRIDKKEIQDVVLKFLHLYKQNLQQFFNNVVEVPNKNR